MLVAQITDVHLGFDPGNPDETNRQRLDAVLAALVTMDPQPDMLLVTGDLVDRGDAASYRQLREALAACPFPVHPCLGNHDDRGTFRAAFPEVPTADGFVQYVVDAGPIRFVVLDTLAEGRHGGGFCDRRAGWLRDTLAAAPDRDTILVLHHPPADTGIDWMTTHPDEPWVARLRGAIAGKGQIVGLLSGHVHRAIVTRWAGIPLIVCPSTSPQVALTLAPIDPDVPDGRAMIVAEPAGYALHHWNGSDVVTHFGSVAAPPVLARFDAAMQPLVRSIIGERPRG